MEEILPPVAIVSTAIQHDEDIVSQCVIEKCQMQRLGLPLNFGGKPQHNRKQSRKSKNKQSITERMEDFRSFFLAERENRNDLTETIRENGDDETQNGGQYESELMHEISTIKLSHDEEDCNSMETIGNRENVADQSTVIVDNELIVSMECQGQESLSDAAVSDGKPFKAKRKRSQASRSNKKHGQSVGGYYQKRFVLFSKFNEGIQLDRESWYSVTPEPIARHIAQRVEKALIANVPIKSEENRNLVILDAFCGAGGNTIQFALLEQVQKVIAIDVDEDKISMARNNATIYGCVDKITFIHKDFFDALVEDLRDTHVDMAFISPPWGGPEYRSIPKYSLANMTPNGFDIVRWTAALVTQNIAILMPRNYDLDELEKVGKIINSPNSAQTKTLLENCGTMNSDLECEQILSRLESSVADLSNTLTISNKSTILVDFEENKIYNKVHTMTAYFSDLVISKK